jgi:hypothetical protein
MARRVGVQPRLEAGIGVTARPEGGGRSGPSATRPGVVGVVNRAVAACDLADGGAEAIRGGLPGVMGDGKGWRRDRHV